ILFHTGSSLYPYTTLFRSSVKLLDLSSLRLIRHFISVKEDLGHARLEFFAEAPDPGDWVGGGRSNPVFSLAIFILPVCQVHGRIDRKSTRLNSSHVKISYA